MINENQKLSLFRVGEGKSGALRDIPATPQLKRLSLNKQTVATLNIGPGSGGGTGIMYRPSWIKKNCPVDTGSEVCSHDPGSSIVGTDTVPHLCDDCTVG